MKPTEDLTARRHQHPSVCQFSVFLDNRVGKLLELLELFEPSPIQFAGFSVVDTADFGVVRFVTSSAFQTRKVLEKAGLPYSITDVLVVEPGKGKELSEVCQALVMAEVNIHYAYPLTIRPNGRPIYALHTDAPIVAMEVLEHKRVKILGEAELVEHRKH